MLLLRQAKLNLPCAIHPARPPLFTTSSCSFLFPPIRRPPRSLKVGAACQLNDLVCIVSGQKRLSTITIIQ